MVINMDIKEGRVVSDAELYATRSGRPKLTFRLTVARDASRAPKYGEGGSGGGRGADLIHVVMYGPRARDVHRLLSRGVHVVVFGWTQSRTHSTQEGGRRVVTETVAECITFASESMGRPTGRGRRGDAGAGSETEAADGNPASATLEDAGTSAR